MWLLNAKAYELKQFRGSTQPPYAILSHTWDDDAEVSFEDVRISQQTTLPGWTKIENLCRQALNDNLDWVWADTCCIDKRSTVEYERAINSMFDWYRKADRCYAYLSDVHSSAARDADSGIDVAPTSPITRSRWFTRGWTLQELLAPKTLTFYDNQWKYLGNRIDYATEVSQRTDIPVEALTAFSEHKYCAAQKLSWAVGRQTTESEDRAYSLLGILDVRLGLIQGEGGERAFYRLQEAIISGTNDTSILAWNKILGAERSHWLLAPTPDCFEGCHIFRDYQPCATDVLLNKTGLSGAFDAYWDCFDVKIACIGHFGAIDTNDEGEVYRDDRSECGRDAVGLPFVDDEVHGIRRVLLDGKQCLLHALTSQRGYIHLPAQRLTFGAHLASSAKRSSSRAHSPHFYSDGNRGISTRVMPGLLWPPDGEQWSRVYITGPKAGEKVPDARIYHRLGMSDTNRAIVIAPAFGHNIRCFVIQNARNVGNGFIVHFWYDTTDRPTARIDHLRTNFPHRVTDFAHIETDAGKVQIASENSSFSDSHVATLKEASQWANTGAFDLLTSSNLAPTAPSGCVATAGATQENETASATTPHLSLEDSIRLPQHSRVVELGPDIRVIFVPQGSGHRVYLSFRGPFSGILCFPREWLWPPVEAKEPPAGGKASPQSSLKKFLGKWK
jgi:hypothetical protein